jgi:hypothetical protein
MWNGLIDCWLGIQERVFRIVVMNSLSVDRVLKSWSQITLPITSMVTLVVWKEVSTSIQSAKAEPEPML